MRSVLPPRGPKRSWSHGPSRREVYRSQGPAYITFSPPHRAVSCISKRSISPRREFPGDEREEGESAERD